MLMGIEPASLSVGRLALNPLSNTSPLNPLSHTNQGSFLPLLWVTLLLAMLALEMDFSRDREDVQM